MLRILFLLIVIGGYLTNAQVTYQGPATGYVTSGVTVSTDDFARLPSFPDPVEQRVRNLIEPESEFIEIDLSPPSIQPLYFEDPAVTGKESGTSAQTVLLNSFPGIMMTNSIPPDPHIAVGPNHVVATVNSRFGIWDKEGNLLKNINADTWYASTISNPGAFDPQIIYDHYAQRWFMLWDSQMDNPPRAHFLISVSDDDSPLGTWYNYALPANQMGMTVVNNWGDFPQIGFDEEAIYINSRQFTFGGSKVYDRIRILNKSELYAANGGQVNWVDIWDITYPHSAGRPDVIHPVISYSPSSAFYFVHASRTGGNFLSIYRLTNPLTNPVLSGFNIPITFYFPAPNANQLGGGTPLISSNESHIKTKPIYRDGYIWAVHSVRHPSELSSTSLRYYKIDMNTSTIVEDVIFGAEHHWYIFPTLTVDKDHNIAITYSRSSLTEYIGGYYTTRLANDPPGLAGSTVLREGQGNYVVTFGGTRNRWGDYLGIYLDPVTEYNIWLFPEHAQATNTWGTWVGEIRLVPYPGVFGLVSPKQLDFSNIEINFQSTPQSVILTNYGADDLIIYSIPDSVGPFKLVSNLNYPITLATYDSMTVDFLFAPTIPAVYQETFMLNTNQSNFPGITMKGKGFQIIPATANIMYAASGNVNSGQMMTIDISTGMGTIIGISQFNEIKSIAIHPQTRIMYGLVSLPQQTIIVRVNAEEGDAYELFSFPIGNMQGIAFNAAGTLYGMTRTGGIYTIDLQSQTANLVVNSAPVTNIAFHPITDELWASMFSLGSLNRDRILQINTVTGDTIGIGNTGFGVATNGIAFDGQGNLYGVIGTSVQTNNFISIDTQTGEGTIIGSVGYPNITGLTFFFDPSASVDDQQTASIPSDFMLMQNYPNPFNPSTKIEFSLPVASNVKLTIYNILGEVVNVLANQQMNAGHHSITWNSDNKIGEKVVSGVYFYELKASGISGAEFTDMKKMVYLK